MLDESSSGAAARGRGRLALRQRLAGADEGLVTSLAPTSRQPRLLPVSTARGSRAPGSRARARGIAAAALAAVAAASLASVPAARAEVAEAEGVKVGLQPRNAETAWDGDASPTFGNPEGNPVLNRTEAFVIYWDPRDSYHPEWQRLVNTYMHNLASESGAFGTVFAADSQYTDRSNESAQYNIVFRGAYTDTHSYPAAVCTDPAPPSKYALGCVTDQQIREELQGFISTHSLPTGMHVVYYVLTPPGLAVCLDRASKRCSDYPRPARSLFRGIEMEIFSRPSFTESQPVQEAEAFASSSYKESFCSYHSAINPGNPALGSSSTVIYAVIPWIAGNAGERALYHKREIDWAYECQDGGFVVREHQLERETPKEETPKEEETFKEAPPKEKVALLEAKERETPHIQEPEQVGTGEDGMQDTGLADLIINQMAVEQQNLVTDPLLNAWQSSNGLEATDECRNFFAVREIGGGSGASAETEAGTLYNQTIGSVHYYLNDAFNLAATKLSDYGVPCVPGIALEPKFTTPIEVTSGEVVGFDGMESDITLSEGTHFSKLGAAEPAYSVFTWEFAPVGGQAEATISGYAPGAPACESPWLSPCAASVFYKFPHGGKYTVTLKVTDAGGNKAQVSNEIDVVGLPGTASTTGSANGTSTTSATTGKAAPAAAPAFQAEMVKQTLSSVLVHGVALRYHESEALTGRFELLLSVATAHALGIRGSAVRGLAGEVRVGEKNLVVGTSKAGGTTLYIKLSKSLQKALRRHRKRSVTIEVRAVVHNLGTPPAFADLMTAPVTLVP